MRSHSASAPQVRIRGVNKGNLADDVLLSAHADRPVDFVLCIGDDEEDEFMLSAVTARASAHSMLDRLRGKLFTVTVGAPPARPAAPRARSRLLRGASHSPEVGSINCPKQHLGSRGGRLEHAAQGASGALRLTDHNAERRHCRQQRRLACEVCRRERADGAAAAADSARRESGVNGRMHMGGCGWRRVDGGV